MSLITRILSKQEFRTFACAYSATYTSFITHHILEDVNHPLNSKQRRLHESREKTGLWWHVTVNSNTSKSKAVRTWLRRRLRNAFIEELKKRGIERDGKIAKNANISGRPRGMEELLKQGETLSLEGSLKLHAQAPLISAKYEDVRMETGKVIDALMQGLQVELRNTYGRGRVDRQDLDQPEWPRMPLKHSPQRTPQLPRFFRGRERITVSMND